MSQEWLPQPFFVELKTRDTVATEETPEVERMKEMLQLSFHVVLALSPHLVATRSSLVDNYP
jgi:hypothetical protein